MIAYETVKHVAVGTIIGAVLSYAVIETALYVWLVHLDEKEIIWGQSRIPCTTTVMRIRC